MMRRIAGIIRISLLFILTVAMVWVAFNIDLVTYGWSQFSGQWNIVHHARPLDEVMKDPGVSDSLKDKIRFIEVVSRFAEDTLGLKRSKNYTTLFDQHNKPLLWVLTASDRYKIEPYLWHFPVLGYVSYKGYFNYDTGKREDSLMNAEGYDTDYGEVSAWSTLGWFKDPILSNMLKRSEGQIAELIIHEMTHATVYVKSDVNFNENLASMIGEEGAIRFLTSHFGKDSKELTDYLFRKSDYDLYSRQMLLGTHLLDSLYLTFSNLNENDKKEKKESMIASIVLSLDTIPFHRPDRYHGIFEKRKPNNASFLNFVRYDSKKSELKRELEEKFNGNIIAYLKHIEAEKD